MRLTRLSETEPRRRHKFSIAKKISTGSAGHKIRRRVDIGQFVETPEQASNSTAFLQIDLNDPEFHRLALENVHNVKSEIRLPLDAAVGAGELAPCDTDRLARAIQAVHSGSMVNWAIYREGTVAVWVRRNMETLLKPLCTRPRRHARSRKSAT